MDADARRGRDATRARVRVDREVVVTNCALAFDADACLCDACDWVVHSANAVRDDARSLKRWDDGIDRARSFVRSAMTRAR